MKLLSILIMSLSYGISYGCKFEKVVKEVGNFHGPRWSTFLKTSGCSKTQVKRSLKKIIETPNSLNEFVHQTQKLIPYRNALKSYGSFLESNSDGTLSESDKQVLVNHYKKLGEYTEGFIEGDEYTSREQTLSFVKTNVLESIKHTGSIGSVEVYNQLMSEENLPAFHVGHISDFYEKIMYGQEEMADKSGDLEYVEEYLPNLKGNIQDRYSSIDRDLLNNQSNSLKENMLAYLKSNNAGVDQIKNKVSTVFDLSSSNSTFRNSTSSRSIASNTQKDEKSTEMIEELQSGEKSQTNSNSWLFFFGLFFVVGIAYYIFRSRK